MDFDSTTLPAVYDAGRGYSPATLDRWRVAITRAAAAARPVRAVLDLGCGTGRYSASLAAWFGADVVALDPSERMLAQARLKGAPGVTYGLSAGEDLPLPDASVDLVFMSMVFHHFTDPAKVARECRRVLGAGGAVVMRAAVAERLEDHPYAPFFPRVRPILRRTFGSLVSLQQVFVDEGFEPSAHEIVDSEVAASWPEYAERIALRADSILIQLDDAAFAAGLAELRAYGAAHPGPQPVIEPTDLVAFRAV